jgi:NADPH:quinone reductase-like Zn-dependent oxidoreductase
MHCAIAANTIYPVIDKQFTFDQTQLALKYLEQGLHFGKVVITL